MKKKENNTIVLYQKENGTAIITLNRIEKRNALNIELIQELMAFLEKADKDPEINSVILTGNGDNSFCSGADLAQEKLGVSGEYKYHLSKYYHPLIRTIRTLNKPVIAVVNGVAAGAGIGVVLACDYIIMNENAQFYVAFTQIGLIPDSGVIPFLLKRLGRYKTFELSVFAGKLEVDDLLKWGIINESVKPVNLMKRGHEVADKFNHSPVVAIGLIKKIINAEEDRDLEKFFDLECELQEIAGSTLDHMEGVQAFLEKRAPVFTGH